MYWQRQAETKYFSTMCLVICAVEFDLLSACISHLVCLTISAHSKFLSRSCTKLAFKLTVCYFWMLSIHLSLSIIISVSLHCCCQLFANSLTLHLSHSYVIFCTYILTFILTTNYLLENAHTNGIAF